jgi:hypothetical protein
MTTLLLIAVASCLPWVLASIIHRVTTKGGDDG